MIEAFVGLPGAGKTYLMTKMALKLHKKGRKIYANYPIKIEGCDMYKDVKETFGFRNGVILIDEAGLVAPSQFWKQIPYEVLSHWRQHRHYQIDMYYTAQDLRDVAPALRRVTQFVNQVKSFGAGGFRVFSWKTYTPYSKEKYGGGIHLFDQSIADCYSSWGDSVFKPSYLK